MGWEKDAPSGLTQTWKLWRNCCCRYGWYPLLITPIVTSGCLLSIYSSYGCEFLTVQVGFTPSNSAWNQSTAQLGLFSYQSGELQESKYTEAFVEGCRRYSDEFEESFISGDRTWKVARIMAFISGVASLVATTTSWLMVVSPLPASFFWPGVLLPAVMIAFLAEGSKFLFFDTSICHTQLWFPTGADSLPQAAEKCELSRTGNFSIAAGSIFFLSLLLVCLKAPQKRALDETFGMRYDETDMEAGAVTRGKEEIPEQTSYDQRSGVYMIDGVHSTSTGAKSSEDRSTDDGSDDPTDYTKSSGSDKHTELDEALSSESSRDGRDPCVIKEYSQDSRDEVSVFISKPSSVDSTDDPLDIKKPAAASSPFTEDQRISESRVSTIQKMELNTSGDSTDLISKFVSDLDQSFQFEGGANDGASDTRTY